MLPLSFDADPRRANRIMVQSRRISKRFARWPETRVPLERQRVTRLTSDLDGRTETTPEAHERIRCTTMRVRAMLERRVQAREPKR